MYHLKPGIKENPEKRWRLPDRIFFGHGACHILAGVYLRSLSSEFYAIWIKPSSAFTGSHIFVTDGDNTFDFHSYSKYAKLISHHRQGWSQKYDGWACDYIKVDFDLLETKSLNERNMRGSDQYLHNPISRAEKFIERFNYSTFKFS